MLIAMGVLLLCAILYIAMTSGGSAKAVAEAGESMWAYIDEAYPEINVKNHGQKPEHTGAVSYSLLVSDADCEDIYFYVSYTNGNIADDYYYRVTEMNNTLLRLERSMGEYMSEVLIESGTDILRAEVTFPPRVRNDIPPSIYLGVSFEPAHPIFRGSTLILICRATDDMGSVAAVIEKAHAVALEEGVLFSYYSVYGMESENVYMLEIDGITAEAIESGRLCDILTSALTGEATVSESDLEGVFAGVYYAGGTDDV